MAGPFVARTICLSSYAMEERYLLAAARYIEMNPVRAGLVDRPGEYPWSSAAANTLGRDDRLVRVFLLLELVDDWGKIISGEIAERLVGLVSWLLGLGNVSWLAKRTHP